MSLSIGTYEADIVSNGISSTNSGSVFVALLCQIGEDQVTAKIFITEKSMGMAKKSLKLCGFDTDKLDLQDLKEDPNLLSGKKVKLEITEDPKYGLQANILLGDVSDAKLKKLTQELRRAGKGTSEPVSVGPSDDEIPF